MKITGRNLELVAEALEGMIENIHYYIASCPDVIEYANKIEELEAEKETFHKLAEKVNEALEKEKANV